MQVAQSVDENAQGQGQGSQFRRRGDIQANGRSRALVDVRQPHVKRHCPKFKSDSDNDECHAEPKWHAVDAGLHNGGSNRVEQMRRTPAHSKIEPLVK